MKKWVLAAALAIAVPAVASAEDIESGKAQFNKCKACHQIGEGAKNGVGPHLNGIIGMKAGTHEGFSYSEAMKKKSAEGLTWTEENLAQWIAGPSKFIPGTKMIFPGIKDEAEVKNVIAYIKSAGGAGEAK